ncbi:hypothetical protein [Nocardia noduli]|uniref:hypothetical protein n=1 Tax=Nocardia noduli TaxID=2815722 RepID=UPI001C23BBF7|nr:hypothetical protein [Nocardia noduli]
MTKLADWTLHHVDPDRLLYQLIDPDDPEDVPSWFAEVTAGGMKLESGDKGAVLVTMETRTRAKFYVAAVSVVGVFKADGRSATSETDDSILDASTREEVDEFARTVVNVLHPFLRAELFMLTSRFSGKPGIMLQPTAILGQQAKPD